MTIRTDEALREALEPRARARGTVSEAVHFVAAAPDGPRSLAELVATSSMEVFDLSRAPELRETAALMERYADTPMPRCCWRRR